MRASAFRGDFFNVKSLRNSIHVFGWFRSESSAVIQWAV